VSYRSKVTRELDGDGVFLAAPSFVTSGPVEPVGALLNQVFAGGKLTASTETREMPSVATAYEQDRLELHANWTWMGWDATKDRTVLREDGDEPSIAPLRVNDSWPARPGCHHEAPRGLDASPGHCARQIARSGCAPNTQVVR
jgi:hypothetical protein